MAERNVTKLMRTIRLHGAAWLLLAGALSGCGGGAVPVTEAIPSGEASGPGRMAPFTFASYYPVDQPIAAPLWPMPGVLTVRQRALDLTGVPLEPPVILGAARPVMAEGISDDGTLFHLTIPDCLGTCAVPVDLMQPDVAHLKRVWPAPLRPPLQLRRPVVALGLAEGEIVGLEGVTETGAVRIVAPGGLASRYATVPPEAVRLHVNDAAVEAARAVLSHMATTAALRLPAAATPLQRCLAAAAQGFGADPAVVVDADVRGDWFTPLIQSGQLGAAVRTVIGDLHSALLQHRREQDLVGVFGMNGLVALGVAAYDLGDAACGARLTAAGLQAQQYPDLGSNHLALMTKVRRALAGDAVLADVLQTQRQARQTYVADRAEAAAAAAPGAAPPPLLQGRVGADPFDHDVSAALRASPAVVVLEGTHGPLDDLTPVSGRTAPWSSLGHNTAMSLPLRRNVVFERDAVARRVVLDRSIGTIPDRSALLSLALAMLPARVSVWEVPGALPPGGVHVEVRGQSLWLGPDQPRRVLRVLPGAAWSVPLEQRDSAASLDRS